MRTAVAALATLTVFSLLAPAALAQEHGAAAGLTPMAIIDVAAIIIGLILFGLIYHVRDSFGGILRGFFLLIIVGIAFQLWSLAYNLAFVDVFPSPPGLQIHDLLMDIGLIFFLFGFYKIATLRRMFKP